MRKVVILGLCLGLIVSLAACTGANSGPNSANLHETIEAITKRVDLAPFEIIDLDKDNFESYAFLEYDGSVKACAADALVNITPHSLVLLYSEDSNTKELAESIFQNANPNKWLCVRAECVHVLYSNHYILLLMTYKDTAAELSEEFKLLITELGDGQVQELSAENQVRMSYGY